MIGVEPIAITRQRAVADLQRALPSIGQRPFAQNLDGHVTRQPRVARAVDFPHPSGTDVLEDFVRPESLAGLKQHEM